MQADGIDDRARECPAVAPVARSVVLLARPPPARDTEKAHLRAWQLLDFIAMRAQPLHKRGDHTGALGELAHLRILIRKTVGDISNSSVVPFHGRRPFGWRSF